MKLLFDQNLAPRLVRSLSDIFPGSNHVRELGLAEATDREVWDHAREAGYTLVSKDNDFQQMSFLFGAPPKVIWLRRGNCSVAETERILRTHSIRIREFESDPETTYLILT